MTQRARRSSAPPPPGGGSNHHLPARPPRCRAAIYSRTFGIPEERNKAIPAAILAVLSVQFVSARGAWHLHLHAGRAARPTRRAECLAALRSLLTALPPPSRPSALSWHPASRLPAAARPTKAARRRSRISVGLRSLARRAGAGLQVCRGSAGSVGRARTAGPLALLRAQGPHTPTLPGRSLPALSEREYRQEIVGAAGATQRFMAAHAVEVRRT